MLDGTLLQLLNELYRVTNVAQNAANEVDELRKENASLYNERDSLKQELELLHGATDN